MAPLVGWQVQQIDLKCGIPDLAVVTPYRGVYAVLWWGEIPLGHCKISAAELPLSSAQLLHQVAAAIAPAVAAYNLPESFRAPLPHAVQTLQRTPALETIMKIDQPLENLPDSPCFSGSISVVPAIALSSWKIVCDRCNPVPIHLKKLSS
jgi:hypothetical protein